MRGICFKEPLYHLIVKGDKTMTRRLQDKYKEGEILYLKEPYFVNEDGTIDYKFDNLKKHDKWKNKLFMPNIYARHFIRITEKGNERLQEITNTDCMKEGISIYDDSSLFTNKLIYRLYENPKHAFADLFDQINGQGTWLKNPIVTKYTFDLIR